MENPVCGIYRPLRICPGNLNLSISRRNEEIFPFYFFYGGDIISSYSLKRLSLFIDRGYLNEGRETLIINTMIKGTEQSH